MNNTGYRITLGMNNDIVAGGGGGGIISENGLTEVETGGWVGGWVGGWMCCNSITSVISVYTVLISI